MVVWREVCLSCFGGPKLHGCCQSIRYSPNVSKIHLTTIRDQNIRPDLLEANNSSKYQSLPTFTHHSSLFIEEKRLESPAKDFQMERFRHFSGNLGLANPVRRGEIAITTEASRSPNTSLLLNVNVGSSEQPESPCRQVGRWLVANTRQECTRNQLSGGC